MRLNPDLTHTLCLVIFKSSGQNVMHGTDVNILLSSLASFLQRGGSLREPDLEHSHYLALIP